jgi:type IV pilus assembly protein PilQ
MKGMSNHQSERRRGLVGSGPTGKAWRGILALLAGLAWATAALAGNTLERVAFSALPGNKVQFRLTLAGPAQRPRTFTTDSPSRLVLDFPGTKLALADRTMQVEVGVAHSLTAVEAGGRTRVVFNLSETVPYDVHVEGNTVLVTLESGAALVSRETQPAAQRMVSHTGRGIQALDFRRGPGGEGRVLITLDRADTLVNLKEEGQRIVLDILNTRLPRRLHEKLDVTDFATPVQSVESEAKGDDVRVTVRASGDYEYLAYQADRLYTLEFRPLTKEEEQQKKKKEHVFTGERLSLNFQDIPVRTVLHLLGDFTNRNMVISDTVKGNITLRLKNVPWDQAMDIILKTKGLDKRDQDNVTYVAPAQELLTQEQVQLKAEHDIQELAPLKSEFIQVNYAKAADLAALLKSPENRLLSPRGQVTVDKRTNTLLVQDTAAQLEDIRRMVVKLDVPVRQVLIESRIVIANNDFARDLGVRFGWSGARQLGGGNQVNIAGGLNGYVDGTSTVNKGTWLSDVAGNPFNAGISNDNASENLLVNLPVTAPTGAVNFLIGKIGSYLLQLELSAMQSEGRGEIISSPRVITSDQNKATIKQGVEIPYQQASASGATSVAFKEAVLQLDVTPQITPDDRINMKLKVNKDSPDFSRQVLGVPPINTSSVDTTVLVDNGETVVLGGIFERTKSDQKDSVPFFGDIPVVGNLFRRTTHSDTNTELLMFITPKILKTTLGAR